jgi:phenylacetate-CoA ligase
MYPKLLRKVIVPLGDLAFGGNYNLHLKEWRKFDKLSEKELRYIQKERLKEILLYSTEKVPYYKTELDLDFEDPYKALKKIPVLTKELLNSNHDDLIAKDFDKEKLKKNFSSGSTGKQSFSYTTHKLTYYNQAIQRHWFEWTGYQEGIPTLQFGISPDRGFIKSLKDFFFNINYESAFSLDDKDFERINFKLKSKKVKFIIGYPSAIFELAKWMDLNNKKHKIDAIISLGDKLFEHYEGVFSKVFISPKILDTYGCAEGFLMAAKYDTPFYYITSPHVYIEIVDDYGKEVDEGELGHVLVTCLTSYAQPFLRYKLGDLAIKLEKSNYPKDKKFNYPLLKKIIGRETDVIKTPFGKNLIVHSFTGIFEHFPIISKYKIIQTSSKTLLIEYISKDKEHDIAILKIKNNLDELTQKSMEISFKKVDKIKAMYSGKPQIIEILNS